MELKTCKPAAAFGIRLGIRLTNVPKCAGLYTAAVRRVGLLLLVLLLLLLLLRPLIITEY